MSPIRGLGLLVLLVASLGGLGFALISRSAPAGATLPTPSQESLARQRLQGALRDASLLDLVRNARIAARKGDEVTRLAMVAGLREDSRRSRDLIHLELSKASDSTDIYILNGLISELLP